MSGNENCFLLETKTILVAYGEKMSPHRDFKGVSLIKLHLKSIPITVIY